MDGRASVMPLPLLLPLPLPPKLALAFPHVCSRKKRKTCVYVRISHPFNTNLVPHMSLCVVVTVAISAAAASISAWPRARDRAAPPQQYKTWTEKYGYGRFFPVYVDKSGFADDDSPAPKAKAAAVSRGGQAGQEGERRYKYYCCAS